MAYLVRELRTAREHGDPLSHFRGAEVRHWTEVDRILALALNAYEDGLCSGCGQQIHESMDGDLLDEWTTIEPHRCGSCTALERAYERNKNREHPRALRYIVGLREGWEKRKAALVAARAERATPGE